MRKLLLVPLFMLGLAFFAQPAPALAYEPFGKVDCSNRQGSGNESAVCENKSKGDPISGSGGILLRISRVIAILAGAAAVIIIVLAGFYFITANGDAGKIASARNAVIYALLGLLIILVARALIVFVVGRL